METALLKVKIDLLAALHNQEVSCLILLDLSAAFDTVSHKLLLNCLKYQFGFGGKILEWNKDYLSNHTQQVKVDDSESELVKLKYGVPQGSVPGLILFTLYTRPHGDVQKYRVKYHCCADDTHSYLSFKPNVTGNQEECIRNLELCIAEIRKTY